MKGLAAVLVELKKPLVLEEIEIPRLSFGQVLVRVTCSGICGAQIGEINGVKGPDRFLPHLLGHEGTATVLECGEGVRRVKPDDTVVMHWRKAAGLESFTPAYGSRLGKVNVGQTVPEQFRLDFVVVKTAVKALNAAIELCRSLGDNGTRDLLEHMLRDEEDHANWLEAQLTLIQQAGEANYLAQQIREGDA